MEDDTFKESPIAKWFILPQRVIIALMCFLAIFNAYTMRITLSLAITHLVVKKNRTDDGSAMCEADDDFFSTAAKTGAHYDWSEHTQGMILSSFYVGYIVTHIPGGILADKFGGKWVLMLGILSTAVFTVLSPVAIIKGGPYWLIGVRILMGLGEGTTFPALSVMLAHWVPKKERGKLGSLVLGGGQMGTIVGNLVSGYLLAHYEWPMVFYFFAILALIWCFIFTLICFSEPATHPYVTKKERDFLYQELQTAERKVIPPTPWKAILTSMPVISMIIAQIGHDWGFFIMVTDLPKYMSDVMRFSIKMNGIYSSVPYVLMWIVSISSGFLADYLITRNIWSITTTRKVMTGVAAFGPGIFMVGASYSGCNRLFVVIMFTLAMGSMGSYYAGMKLSPLDMSPNYSGILMALTNGIASAAGIVAPYLVGVMTPNATMLEWRMVFWVALCVLSSTAVVYCIWASGEVQPFDNPQPKSAKD